MGSSSMSSWAMYLLFIMLVNIICHGTERASASDSSTVSTSLEVLLAFRKAIRADPTQALASWVDSGMNTTTGNSSSSNSSAIDYCAWNGVVCHLNTQEVKGILLAERQLQGSITPMLGRLPHLLYLNLSFNGLSGGVPPQLGACTTLLELALNDNHLEGALPPELNNLTRLQILSAGDNNLRGPLPRLTLPALQVLNLTSNSLQGDLAPVLPGCSGLRVLHLSSNHFAGPVPASIGNLSQLGYLELADNSFTSISPSIANCTHLYHLNLWSNRITGFVPASWFTGFSNLSFLCLGVNQFTGTIPSTVGTLFRLQTIVLGGNHFEGHILHHLLNCTSLTTIDVFQNNFTESLPVQLGSSLPHLTTLGLELNRFNGPIPASLGNCTGLQYLMMGINYGISGPLPKELFGLLKLQKLDLQFNNLTGELPSEIGNQSSALTILILNNNFFVGSLPPQLGLLQNLQGVTFQFNRFKGSIPHELGNSTNILHLHAFNNLLSGAIPSSLGQIKVLEILALEHNQLAGSIPTSLSNCTRLQNLTLNDNRLEGAILRAELPGMLRFDLSNNQLSGAVPAELIGSMTQVSFLDLSFNKLSGAMPASLAGCVSLVSLNLSSNQLSGSIASALAPSLKSLQSLNLSQNSMSGPIPSELGNLTSLQSLDLSFNHLSGEIPDSLTWLANLTFLNVSYNSLEGALPASASFLLFSAASFLGNPGLCGSLLNISCAAGKPRSASTRSSLTIALIAVGSLLLLLLLASSFAFVVWRWLRKRKATTAADIKSPFLRLTLKEIQEATDNFGRGNILGSGGTSVVYRGTTKDGKTLAFKKMLASRSEPESPFFAEIKSVGQVRHRNLVKVLGYYSDLENDILIMEYMPNGNLSDYLHGMTTPPDQVAAATESSESNGGGSHVESTAESSSSREHGAPLIMSWNDRVEAAKSIATGLAYLHHDCPTPIIHMDVKPTNILLDAGMNVRISDFGLARLLQGAVTHASAQNVKGSFCYMAPEYVSFGKISKKCDVFSYGIVLMEIVTKRSPTNDLFKEGLTLRKWVQSKILTDGTLEESFVDLCMDTQNYTNEEREQVSLLLNVAMMCTKDNPNERPTMEKVSEQLGCTTAYTQTPHSFDEIIEKLACTATSSQTPDSF